MKFRLKKEGEAGAVSGLRIGPRMYLPGDEVDLPPTYDGAAWLERVEDPVPVASAELENTAGKVPFEAKKKRKKS